MGLCCGATVVQQEECRALVVKAVPLNWVAAFFIGTSIYRLCARINDILVGLFRGIGIKLVDFKIEYGKTWNRENEEKEIVLADEISPDTCRLWDSKSEKKLDKDRFRKDLGNIIQGYQEVARRLNILHEQSNIRPISFPKPKAVKIKKK